MPKFSAMLDYQANLDEVLAEIEAFVNVTEVDRESDPPFIEFEGTEDDSHIVQDVDGVLSVSEVEEAKEGE